MTLAATDRYRMAVRELGWRARVVAGAAASEAVAILVPGAPWPTRPG